MEEDVGGQRETKILGEERILKENEGVIKRDIADQSRHPSWLSLTRLMDTGEVLRVAKVIRRENAKKESEILGQSGRKRA